MYPHQEAHQGQELLVVLVLLERGNGYTVAELLPEAVDGVVDQDHVLHLNVLDYPQVLQVHAILCLDATLAVETVLDELTRGINVVQYFISIPLVARREDSDLVVLVHLAEHLLGVGADVERSLELPSGLQTDLQLNVGLLLGVLCPHAMGQGLIEIEEQELIDAQVSLL